MTAAALPTDPTPDRALPPSEWRRGPALLLALATVGLHVVFAAGYGYHRDELYFLAESKRLDWGFVSEQPFVPALGAFSKLLFGDSVVAARLWPALAGAGVVLIATVVAARFGGGLVAQLSAGMCVGTSTISLALFHLFGPSAFDQLAWAGCLLVLVRLLDGLDGFDRTDDRWWLGFGAIAGLGLWNKNTLVMLAIALVVAVAVTRERWGVVRSPWPWAGGALAVLIASPNLVWQAVHGWPMLEIAATVREDEGGPLAAALFVPMQVLTMNPLLAPVWIAGLVWLARSARYRLLAWVFAAMVVLLLVVGGRSYYLAPMYVLLFAAGAVVLERWAAGRRWRPAALPVALVAAAAVILPSALPVLPVEAHRDLPFATINPIIGESIGWPGFVEQVAAVRNGLPAAERAGAVVLTTNYGQAGAIEMFGAPYGLGQPVSGHNSYWDWGPPPAATSTVVAVGFTDPARLATLFGRVERAGTIDNGVGIDNEEQGAPIWICREPRAPWSELWPQLRRYNA
ncbi:ArnT family glycosyltransferase [Pseudonocardia sp. TRM90224]|uniref:ArnT family glycosyltransferase n=1 Tax=Pseudonocardia sp. TRM90224 TaxID=2812678 RepID=UPI001E53DBC5|nr:glycosyltransferase family 39 protein [Pseudonocardia sp. TRM90224]